MGKLVYTFLFIMLFNFQANACEPVPVKVISKIGKKYLNFAEYSELNLYTPQSTDKNNDGLITLAEVQMRDEEYQKACQIELEGGKE